MKKSLIRRNSRLARLALIGLALVAIVFVPVILAGFLAAPKVGAGLTLAAMAPVAIRRSPYSEEGTLSMSEFQGKVLTGVKSVEKEVAQYKREIESLKETTTTQAKQIMELRRSHLSGMAGGRQAPPGMVSEDCARHFAGIYLLCGLRNGKLQGDQFNGMVKDILGIEARTAVTSSDIPLPVGYNNEVVQLVSQYGAARKYGTVFPLGNGVVNLPKLKTSPTFSLIAGSGAVPEVVPQTEWVTFTAQKFGGLVRLPSEIEEDSVFAMGQFLAQYTAREIARVEDHNYFMSTGAGSGLNGAVKGLCLSTIDNSKVTQMGSGKTKYSDATLANIRALRSVVDAPALGYGAYYMHPSFEQHLSGLNTSGDKPYVANAAQGATLDGFPIRWVDIMPAYSTNANASKVFMLFGDLRYQYLGIRGQIRFDTSLEAAFSTDEVLVRALERLTIGLMADGAIGGLETAAA